jgi:hypothetical protein
MRLGVFKYQVGSSLAVRARTLGVLIRSHSLSGIGGLAATPILETSSNLGNSQKTSPEESCGSNRGPGGWLSK